MSTTRNYPKEDKLQNFNKDHYIHKCEQRKYAANDYCRPCMHGSTSTAVTIGCGKESSRKTKGRKKREKFMSGKDFSLKLN